MKLRTLASSDPIALLSPFPKSGMHFIKRFTSSGAFAAAILTAFSGILTASETAEIFPVGLLPTSINVKDYGAKGDGKEDDTEEIQAAINAAMEIESKHRMQTGLVRGFAGGSRGSSYPEVYFPDGAYRISDVIFVRESLYLRGSGKSTIVQTSPEKDVIYFHSSYRNAVEGLAFDGGKIQLRFWTNNNWARIVVSGCRFLNSMDYAVECRSFTKERLTGSEWNRSKPWAPYLVAKEGGKWQITPNNSEGLTGWYNSTLFSIELSQFENCMKAVNISGDTTLIRDCSITTNPAMEGGAFRLSGLAHVYGLKGKAMLDPAKHQYWIDGAENLALRDVELDTDSEAGICLVRYFGKPGQPVTPGIRIENSSIKAAGSREGALVQIKAGTMPNILSITNVKETSGKPVNAVVWEETPSRENLEKMKWVNGQSVENQFKIIIGNNSASINASLPESLQDLVQAPISEQALGKTFVSAIDWNDAPADGQKWTVIDAREHGVDSGSREDQTTAIQKLFDHAGQVSNPMVVFPGGAFYNVSETIRLPRNIAVRAAGVAFFKQTDAKKDIFRVDDAQKVVFKNIDLSGGRNGILIHSNPTTEALAVFDYCSFFDQEGAGIHCLSGGEETAVPNRTKVVVQNAIFLTEQAVITNADQTLLRAFWAMNDAYLSDAAFIENRGGKMRIEAMLGNPRLWVGRRGNSKKKRGKLKEGEEWPYSRNTRWIDNWGQIYCQDNRFGGESGGMCNVFNRSAEGTVYISGGLTRFINTETRMSILFAEQTPRSAVLREISGVPIRTDGKSARVMNPDGTPFEEAGTGVQVSGVLPP